MVKVRALLLLLLAALLLPSCSRVPPQRWASADYTGTVREICSPVDAGGHELRLERLSGRGPPLVIIMIWTRGTDRDGFTLRLDSVDDQGQLLACAGPQDCQAVGRAFVQLESDWQQGPATGRFWSRRHGLAATFRAEPTEGPGPICG